MSNQYLTTQFSQEELNNEEWRVIPTVDGIYSVSNLGRIRRNTPRGNTYVGKILKGRLSRKGYFNVILHYGSNKKQQRLVHTVVCDAFFGSKPEGFQCNHKDGIKTNNRIENLEYITPTQNVKHAYDNGLSPSGKLNPRHIKAMEKTHCSQGHEFTTDNIVPWEKRRRCLICYRQASKKRTERYRLKKKHITYST